VIADRLSKNPHLRKHFVSHLNDSQLYLSTGASIHGRFLLKAWEFGLEGVDIKASSLVIEGVKVRMILCLRLNSILKLLFSSSGTHQNNSYSYN